MSRLMTHLAFVIGTTMAGGLLGGMTGREVGRHSPSFVAGLLGNGPNFPVPPGFRPDEFGLGLGIVSGLFFGAGASLVLVALAVLREAWQARLDLARTLAEARG